MTTRTTSRRSVRCSDDVDYCSDDDRCADGCAACRARAEEARAARRDAVLHRLATTRPRRAVR